MMQILNKIKGLLLVILFLAVIIIAFMASLLAIFLTGWWSLVIIPFFISPITFSLLGIFEFPKDF